MMANGFCRWAVPFFFAASGFLLAQHADEDGWYGVAIKKRIKTLLVPYVIWTLLATLVSFLLRAVANLSADRPVLTNFPGGWCLIECFGAHPYSNAHGPLWFVQTLMCFILLSPIYVCVGRMLGWLLPSMLLAVSYLQIPPMPFHLNPSWMMYFSAGVVARFYPIRVGKFMIWLLPLGMLWIAYHKYCMLMSNTGTFELTPLPAIVMIVIGVWSIIPDSELPKWASGLSFPIYVLHYFWALLGGYALPKVEGILMWLFSWTFIVLMSILTTRMVRRVPSIADIVFGCRK